METKEKSFGTCLEYFTEEMTGSIQNNDPISQHIRCLVYKGIWQATAHCKPSKLHSCQFQTSVGNPLVTISANRMLCNIGVELI